MSKFNQKTETTRTTNLAGGKAFKLEPKMELISAVFTTFLEDKFYEKGKDRIDRITNLINKVDNEFIAKLAVYTRTKLHLRSVSHLLIGELSKKDKGTGIVKKAIKAATERPDDLTEIVSLFEKPIPNQIKKGIALALPKFNRYQLAKYKMEGKKVSLVDLFNIAHPKPTSKEQEKDWRDLIEGNLKNEETWETKLSSGENKKEAWADLVMNGKLGYMALLRNLRNIDKTNDDKVINKACEMIRNPEAVKKSKQLPFRFYTAFENVSNNKMTQSISDALDISVDNVPEFNGKTLVGIDTSGSMQGRPINIASLFASALLRKNDCDVVLYSTAIKEFKYLRQEPILTMMDRIKKDAQWGGTNTSLVFDHAIDKDKKYDRIVILSDNESWQDTYWCNSGTQERYNAYRAINDCPVYAIDIEGYGTKDIESPNAYHFSSWSEKIFDFMKMVENKDNILAEIENIKL